MAKGRPKKIPIDPKRRKVTMVFGKNAPPIHEQFHCDAFRVERLQHLHDSILALEAGGLLTARPVEILFERLSKKAMRRYAEIHARV